MSNSAKIEKSNAKILFISDNSHQTKYFNKLCLHLDIKSDVAVRPFSLNIFKIYHIGKQLAISNILKIKFLEINLKYKNPIHNILYKFILKLKTYFIVSGYFNIIDKSNANIISFWNGKKYPQNIGVEITKLLGKHTLFFENAALPNSTAMDFFGINATASISRDINVYLDYKLSKNIPIKLVEREEERSRIKNDIVLPDKFIFVPFQVGYDSQIIYHSPWIESMYKLFTIIDYLATKNKLMFIIKEHPSDKINNYSKLHEIAHTHKYIKFANIYKTEYLIEKCEAIMTINSSVGMEGMLFGKRVIVLGEAFYDIKNISKGANNIEELDDILSTIYDWIPDRDLMHRFISYLVEEYYVPESWKNPTKIHFDTINSRIKSFLLACD